MSDEAVGIKIVGDFGPEDFEWGAFGDVSGINFKNIF